MRAYWDGKNFYSRNNLMFDAPEWFKENLPKDSHLDGEATLAQRHCGLRSRVACPTSAEFVVLSSAGR